MRLRAVLLTIARPTSCSRCVDGPRSVEIILPSTTRSWLEHGDVLQCTADSKPPATYHWTVDSLDKGRRLNSVVGDRFVVDVCSAYNKTERRPPGLWLQVLIRCVAIQLVRNATTSVQVNLSSAALNDARCGNRPDLFLSAPICQR